jgi:hypothetical protein
LQILNTRVWSQLGLWIWLFYILCYTELSEIQRWEFSYKHMCLVGYSTFKYFVTDIFLFGLTKWFLKVIHYKWRLVCQVANSKHKSLKLTGALNIAFYILCYTELSEIQRWEFSYKCMCLVGYSTVEYFIIAVILFGPRKMIFKSDPL